MSRPKNSVPLPFRLAESWRGTWHKVWPDGSQEPATEAEALLWQALRWERAKGFGLEEHVGRLLLDAASPPPEQKPWGCRCKCEAHVYHRPSPELLAKVDGTVQGIIDGLAEVFAATPGEKVP